MSYWEVNAFTGWRRVLRWRPGERKSIKRLSHRRDRRVARQVTHAAVGLVALHLLNALPPYADPLAAVMGSLSRMIGPLR